MQAQNFSLSSYLSRIGFQGNPKPDIQTLCEMMRCQLLTVPFENLDVQAGKVVSLVPEEIVEKIVNCKRGGYCYELNGLFAMALTSLGLQYQFVAARPMIYSVKRPKTHMAILVTIDDIQWLCDLGFGSYGIRSPMRLDELDTDQQQDFDTFRLSCSPEGNYLLQAFSEGQWANQYEFNLSPHDWIDFMPSNYLNSTHPDAIFVQKLLIVLHTVNGRKILFGNLFKSFESGIVSSVTVPQNEITSLLSREFGLEVA